MKAKKKGAPKGKAKAPAKKAAPPKKKKVAKVAKKTAKSKPAKPAKAKAKPGALPEGMSWIIPYLTVRDVKAAIEFYGRAFGMKQRMAMPGPDGAIMHAEITHEDTVLMLGPEDPERGTKGPTALGGSPVTIMLYVRDVDAWHRRAVDAGARSIMAPEDQFWGDRTCLVLDPDGHKWFAATHVRDVSPTEMAKAMQADEEEPAAPSGGPTLEREHTHAHEHAPGATHLHAHEHEHPDGTRHSHEHEHGHEGPGHSHEGPHDHEHTHGHDHPH